MRKKFTLLFAALLACAGVMKAQYYVIESVGENITDLNALTEDSYVALYNVGKSKYIYEGGDHKLYMGTAAVTGAGHEYIWQVHKEGEKFLFTSASGRYFSTPLDGEDVYAVKSDNAAKDKFTITAHQEDGAKWLVQSTNNSKYWDAQDARFVGWAGSGANSQYEIRPVTVSAAAENDFNKLITTSEDDIKWYTIKNVRKEKYATYAGDEATMTQQATATGASFFYFTGRETADGATVGIHNLFAGDNLCAKYNSWTTTGIEWYIKKQSTGMSICTSSGEWDAWNDAGGGGQKIEYWSASDPGSAWQIEIVTDFTEYLTAAKAAAILEVEQLSGVSAIYANVAEQFKTEIKGVTENSAESLLAVNNILEDFRKSIDGKSMKFRVDGRGSRFLGYNKTSNRIETLVLGFDDAYWTLKYVGNGYFKLYNPVNKVWLGAPDSKWDEREVEKENQDGSTTKETVKENYRTPGLANEADASLYKFEVTTGNGGGTTVLLVAGNGNIAHAAGDHHIMHYHSKTDQASWWAITDVVTFSMTYDEYKEFLSEKSEMMNNLIGYAKQLQDNYGLVKSGDKIAVVVNHPSGDDSQPSSNLLDGNNGTYVHSAYSGEDNTTNHYIEVELSEATRNIFCYFSRRNVNNRPSVVKVLAGNSADALTEVATLNLAESTDNDVQAFFSGAIDLGAAYTHLRFVVTKTNTGSKFFTLSEFYVLPVNTTTEGIAALAGASIVDTDLEARLTAAEKSLKNLQLPETLAEVKAALDANVSNHVTENPALGQYTTAAYNELKVAYEACTSIDQLDAVFVAFDKFKKSKNLPVFTISNGNVKDYAKGKSIYDDNDGKLNFKATNVYDKSMWWALDMTETAVKVTEKVDIYNVGTGNGFWDAASIKITETNENDGAGIADDNIFLFYTVGGSNDNTPIHFQSDYSEIVHWGSYDAKSGSAAMFTYIGNTNDLNKLTEKDVAAVVEENGFRTFYAEFPAAIDAATAAGKTIDLISNITLGQAIDINKVVTLNLNGKTINYTGEGYAFEVTGELILEGAGSINGGIHYIINDNDYKQAEKAYAMKADKEGVDISYIRSFGHTNWQVLYVPFAIPVASMSEFDVYAITNASDKAVVVDQVTEDKLTAHTPYLIKAQSTGDKTIFVKNGTLEKTAPENDYSQKIGGYTFTGTYAAKPITAETEYVLTGGEWCQLDNSNQVLGAFRVYLTVDGSAAPVLRIMTRGEEDTTAIDSAVLNVQPSSVIYDLLGRRVEKMDKGIYIVNGRKVVVK